MVIIGKRIHSTDISDVEMEIKGIKRKIDRLSNKIYQELLGAEAAFLYDQLTLNILKEPQQMSFLDWVIHELNLKIQIAEKNSVPNSFNFNVYVYVMAYGEYSYLKIICPNEKLLKAFDGLEDYSLSESECSDKNNKKSQEWQELHKIYENTAVLSLNLTAMLNPDKDKIKIPSKAERCQQQARHDMTNHYLKQISNGESIPPYLIMRCMDEAMKLIIKPETKSELRRREMQLEQILVEDKDIFAKLFPDIENEQSPK